MLTTCTIMRPAARDLNLLPSKEQIRQAIRRGLDYDMSQKYHGTAYTLEYNDGEVCQRMLAIDGGVDWVAQKMVDDIRRKHEELWLRRVFGMSENEINKAYMLMHELSDNVDIGYEGGNAVFRVTVPVVRAVRMYETIDEARRIPVVRRAVRECEIPAIKDIATYNDRVVKVEFADGTFTKCVADSEEEYDFYTGLAFCLFKKLLGADGHKKFNELMKYALRRDGEIEREKGRVAREQKSRKEKQRKAALKRAAKMAKKRQEQIDIQSEAMLDALRKHDNEI